MLASVFAEAAACGDSAGPEPPCPGGIYRDVADMLVLMAVFAFGWMLFSPGTRLGLVAAERLFGKRPSKLKAVLGAESAEASDAASRSPKSAGPRQQRAAAASGQPSAPCAGVDAWCDLGFDPGLSPRGYAPPKNFDSSTDISLASTPSTCAEAILDELAYLGLPSSALPSSGRDSGDEGSPRESWSFDWDFEAAGGTSPTRTPWAPSPALDAEEVDSQLRVLAAGADLAACWGLWHAVPPGASLGEATCVALASAVERRATTPADADYALEVAEASGNAKLADAALSAGARLRSAAWFARALSRLHAAGLPRRPQHAAALARAYGRERRADLAVELWRRERRGEGPAAEEAPPEGEEDLYAAALEACAGAGDFEAAARLARGAKWRAPRSAAGQRALLSLARWLARRQDLGPARRCEAAVRAAGGEPDLPTLRALLAASARSADMAQARALFDEIISEGLTPDLRTYSAMIRGYCAIGSLEKALSYFDSMRARGVVPDTSIFDSMLDACASRSMLELTEKVFADMEAAGVPPSNMTLAILLRLHGSRGDVDRAMAVFEELPERHGLEVSSHAHGALVSACLAAGHRDLALEAFGRMAELGFRPNARTFEVLIASCVSHGDLDQAVRLVDDALVLSQTRSGDEGGSPATAPAGRVLLDTTAVEDLLRLIGRRRQALRLGVPLLERLESAGFTVSESLAESLIRSAKPGGAGSESTPSPWDVRRAERRSWCQDFVSGTPAAAT